MYARRFPTDDRIDSLLGANWCSTPSGRSCRVAVKSDSLPKCVRSVTCYRRDTIADTPATYPPPWRRLKRYLVRDKPARGSSRRLCPYSLYRY
ncbi:hypothetical protein EVAR_7694_1 [Eumeta japonica]|uniref:Uncharacterized protein n=1 Tax=Eumeta variegata TaxID=151549 RepID=A0A4C1TJK6_EUMVA|nr:hypothetical protein EVAR_7694_1 [Eumeta japonica]